MKMILVKKHPQVTAIVAGVLLGLGFVWPMLAVVSLLGIFISIYLITTLTSWWQVAYCGLLVFWIKSLCVIFWSWSVYPIEWVGLSSSVVQISLILLYWLTGALWLGVGGAICFLAGYYTYHLPRLPRFSWYLLMPFLWLGGEIVSAFTFSLITLGPGSMLQSYFSFGFIGYLFGTVPFGLYLAKYAGVYGLTLIWVLIAVLVYRYRTAGWQKLLAVGVTLGICGLVVQPGVYVPHSATTVIGIDTNFTPVFLAQSTGERERTVLLDQSIRQALEQKPAFILLPEDSRFRAGMFGEASASSTIGAFLFLYRNPTSILIDSGRTELPTGMTVLRASIFDPISKHLYEFDKQYLVPQGEYVPYSYGGFMRLLGYGSVVDSIAHDSAYRPGPLTPGSSIPQYLPGILFCFESVRPDGVRNMQTNRVLPFVVHPISHGWFHSSKILWQQLDVMLQIQSRYAGVPIVSAGNMAPGKLYVPDGRIENGEVVGGTEYTTLRQFSF